jgi:hypothetical protein
VYISIPTRDCRAAITKAIIVAEERYQQDVVRFKHEAYHALHGGAVYNGMKVDAAREQEMREMVDRDAEHMLDQHPVKQTLEVLKLLGRMIEHNSDHLVTIDDADFSMLEEYLPPVAREYEAPAEDAA